jgi:hypothetical protein
MTQEKDPLMGSREAVRLRTISAERVYQLITNLEHDGVPQPLHIEGAAIGLLDAIAEMYGETPADLGMIAGGLIQLAAQQRRRMEEITDGACNDGGCNHA